MRIEELRQSQRSERVILRFEDGSSLKILPSVVADFGLYAGLELSAAELERIRAAAGEASAKNRAVRIISASNVSHRALEQRLIQKGEDAENARAAVRWLDELNLLDDRATARQIVDSGLRKGYGEARLRQMLYEKQIPRALWDEVLSDLPEMDEAIDAYLQKRFGKQIPNQKEVKSAVDALLRRGHRYGDIRAALHRLQAETEDFPED